MYLYFLIKKEIAAIPFLLKPGIVYRTYQFIQGFQSVKWCGSNMQMYQFPSLEVETTSAAYTRIQDPFGNMDFSSPNLKIPKKLWITSLLKAHVGKSVNIVTNACFIGSPAPTYQIKKRRHASS